MQIHLKKGLNIPLSGSPSSECIQLNPPQKISLNLSPFEKIRFKILVKPEEKVKIGQPLVENKAIPGQMFVSPACGTVSEVRRGLKRRLIDIVIQVSGQEEPIENKPFDFRAASRGDLIAFLMKGGAFPHIRMRPFNLVANPQNIPRDIFVSALESLPFVPSAEQQVKGWEHFFQTGLEGLNQLTSGDVHLVFWEETSSSVFREAEHVKKHTIMGPHPAASHSIHIHHIAPIKNAKDIVWTLSTSDVITIGRLLDHGVYHTERILSVAGDGIKEGKRGLVKGRQGYPIADLMAGRTVNAPLRYISGEPLTGSQKESGDFLEFYHTSFTAIPENTKREPFHFLKIGRSKYTATKTYLSGHVNPPSEGYPFTTSQHGEHRAFIDAAVYDKVMPMRIPTMHFIKAILAEDFELAEKLGLLEVASQDFALPAFISPSKIEMMEIVKNGLHQYAREMGY